MVASEGIIKMWDSDRVILEGKKRMRGHYYLVESSMRREASRAGGVQSEVEL